MRRCGLHLIAALSAIFAADASAGAEDLFLRTYHPVRTVLQDFVAASLLESDAANTISHTIASDLKQSEKFSLINPSVFAEKSASVDEMPEFADWRAIDAQELIVGRAARQADGRIKVDFRLWDVRSRAQIAGREYTCMPDDARRIGHMISEAIYERTTGEKRAFEIP